MNRPDPKWLVEVWAEAELVTSREITGSREHADAVGAELVRVEKARPGARAGTWEVTALLALRVHGDVFWNDRAPAGWVEIQRDDSGPTESDAAAALLVCEAAGVPASCAMLTGNTWDDAVTRSPVTFYPLDAEPEHSVIVVVPAVVAWLAHLLDDEQLADTNEAGS